MTAVTPIFNVIGKKIANAWTECNGYHYQISHDGLTVPQSAMKLTNSAVPVYTVSGQNISSAPDWQPQKKRKNKDPEYANRVELLQDFEFEEASQCVRISEDGDWVMSTGTYKPQIHTHFLPNLSLSWARHTDTLNKTFVFLSTDYSKTVHLQEDRSVELHTPGGRHHALRIPRYGRDLAYDRESTEILIPSVGTNGNGLGEVFRINLERGQFMEPFEVDVGGNEMGGGGLQGGISTGAVNTQSIAEGSHGLMAFGTTLGTVEFWDSRSRARVATVAMPTEYEGRSEVTALDFHRSGINIAAGTSSGLVYLYDLRSPTPTLRKDQGYGYPIHHLEYLHFSSSTKAATTEPKILSADKKIIKIWEERDGTPWTSVEPSVDINSVAWCKDSGMFLTANEGRQQHAFFVPQLGPAPKWCSFLDNVVEEMADDPNDPLAYNRKTGEVYDNHKFLTIPQLRALNIDHLIGKTNLLRPYMHGFFVDQKLYDEARIITNPTSWEEERAKRVQAKIDKERESRIRGKKKVEAKVNRKMLEQILDREEKNERKRAQRVLAQGGDAKPQEPAITTDGDAKAAEAEPKKPQLLGDSRFASMFENPDFEIDETSREFQMINPSTKVEPRSNLDHERGLTAVEEELVDEVPRSSASEDDSDDDDPFRKSKDKISTADYKRGGRSKKDKQKDAKRRKQLEMRVSHSNHNNNNGAGGKGGVQQRRDQSFGARVHDLPARESRGTGNGSRRGVVGDKIMTFEPTREPKQRPGMMGGGDDGDGGRKVARGKDRRSASGNTFRRM